MPILPVPSFNDIPGITAAMSLVDPTQPADFSMLPTGPADEPTALTNRSAFAKQLGFDPAKLAIPKEIHSATVLRIEDGYTAQPGDALITDTRGWLLGVTVADCVPILIADPNNHAIAAIHSGWRGTVQNIAAVAVRSLAAAYGSQPTALQAWIGPSAKPCCYEVKADVANQFDPRYVSTHPTDMLRLDVSRAVYDQLLAAGLTRTHISTDPGCTIHDPRFASARRDKTASGRMLAAIGLRSTTNK